MKKEVINDIHTLKVDWTAASKVVEKAVALAVTMDLLATRDLKQWRLKKIGVYVSV